jgi:hypothetical protein
MRDRFASQRGISMILVVCVVVLTIILTVTALLLYARVGHYENQLKDLDAIDKEETAKEAVLSRKIKENIYGTGMGVTGEDLTTLATGGPADQLAKRSKEVFKPMDEKLAVIPAENRDKLKQLEDTIEAKSRELGIYPTLQQLVEVAALRVLYAKNLNDQLTLQKTIAETHAKSVTEMIGPVTQGKINYKAFLTEQIAEVNKLIQKEDEQYNERQKSLTEARDAANQGLEAENARYYDWELRMKNEIRERQRQLEELKIKEAIKFDLNSVHGKILRPDIPNKMAFINIGSRDRVVPGLKFMAAKRADQGKFHYKAEIEVKKVWPTYSEVSITKIFDRDVPVIEGDAIINPLFNTRRPMVVCFAGEENVSKIRPAWDVQEASRRIREIGSEVRANLGLDVDFVIFTEAGAQRQQSAYPNFAKAVTLGVPYEEAAEIYRFLGD